MGKDWDKDKGGRTAWIAWFTEIMQECYRVLKPGAHGLIWALPRTSHWTGMALEDAGFEIRDSVHHIFGSGFPKSLNVSKAIDKMAGAEREVIGKHPDPRHKYPNTDITGGRYIGGTPAQRESGILTAPATPDAEKWQGWGTALKPAHEVWWLVRKPLVGTVAGNVLEYGTGAINIDASRINPGSHVAGGGTFAGIFGNGQPANHEGHNLGRWPANVILSHSEDCGAECALDCPARVLDEQSGESKSTGGRGTASQYPDYDGHTVGSHLTGMRAHMGGLGDFGGASRYFKNIKPEVDQLCSSMYNIEKHRGQPCGDELAKAENMSVGRLTESNIDNLPTAGYGSRPTAQFQKVTKSTILTETLSITTSAISNLSQPDGTTITTSGLEKTTELLPELKSDYATDASSTSLLTNSRNGQQELTKDTANSALLNTCENGGLQTGNITTPTCESITDSTEENLRNSPRFFYQAKPSRRERNAGLEGMPEKLKIGYSYSPEPNDPANGMFKDRETKSQNTHPTVKSIALMRYLCRLVTPEGGTVLDPFMGSGSTGCAAVLERFEFIGIEQDADYLEIAKRRIDYWAGTIQQLELGF